MKQLSRLLTGAALVAAGVVLTQAEAISAKVQKGTAAWSVDGEKWEQINEGAFVREGATIRTAKSEVVDLYLGANGPLLRVEPNSEIVLTALNREKGVGETIANTEILVTKGEVVGLTTKVNAASKYQVKTASTTTSIRGAKFAAKAGGSVAVKEGLATVIYAAVAGTTGTKFNVKDGLVFEPQGNAGSGSVAAMSDEEEAAMADDLDSMVDSLRVSFARYVPSPQWLSIQRPFEYLGAASATDPAFTVPGVTIPTTPGILPPFSPASPSDTAN
jgi:hypothetical protein